MGGDFVHWKRDTLEERIRRRYRVDRDMAHLIAQRYLNLALVGLDPGTTIREAYTGEELERLLDKAAATVQQELSRRD